MTSQLKVDRISPATGSEIIIDGLGEVGKVLQYDYQLHNTELQTASTDWMDTGFELNFTPKSATSKLRITASLKVDSYKTNSVRSGKSSFRIWRDNSAVIEIERGSYRDMSVTNNNRGFTGWLDLNYVDTIGAILPTNYKIQFRNQDTNTTIFSANEIGVFEIMEVEL